MLKFWRYVLKSMGQNPVRTVLTVFGVGLAAFIVIYLLAVFDSRDQMVSQSDETLLVLAQKDIY